MTRGPRKQAATYADGQWHRLHPLTPVLRGGLAVAAIAGVFLATLWDQVLTAVSTYVVYREFPDASPEELPPVPFGESLVIGTALIGVAAVVGAGWLWLSWWMHTVRIDDDVIEVKDGVLFRTHRRARRDRVNSVAIWRPIVPRILGLSKLEFQAAGSDANVTLSYLAHPVAHELRQIVVQDEHRSGDEANPGDGEPGPEVVRHVEVPLGRLLGSLLVSLETAWLTAVFVLIVGGFVITGELEWWIGAFPAALVYAIGIARGLSRASQFRLESVGEVIRVSYGLLSTTQASIPPDKVHALYISQPWPWRMFGWWRVEIHRAITPGQTASNQAPSHQMVLPVGRLDDVREVARLFVGQSLGQGGLDAIATVAPGTLDDPREDDRGNVTMRPGRLARLRLILSYPIHRLGIVGEALWMRTGVLVRKLSIVPLRRIQSSARFRGPWHAVTGLDGIECNIVPGPGLTKMIGFEPEDARPFAEQLSSRVVASLSDQTKAAA